MLKPFFLFALPCAVIALDACSGSTGSQSGYVAPTVFHSSYAPGARPNRVRDHAQLFVIQAGGGEAFEFQLPSAKLTGSLQLSEGEGAKTDRHGVLYVTGPTSVTTYPRGSSSQSFVYNSSALYDAWDVAISSKGDVYVDNNCCGTPSHPSEINVFHHHINAPFETIIVSTSGSGSSEAYGLAFDSKDDLYVGVSSHGVGDVLEIPAGQTLPVDLQLQGLEEPSGIAIDANGNIVVMDALEKLVSIYVPGSKQAARQITGACSGSYQSGGFIAFGPSGKELFVSCTQNGRYLGPWVAEMDYATGKMVRKLGQGQNWHPTGIAVGAYRPVQ